MTICFSIIAANFINKFLLLRLFILGQRLLGNAFRCCKTINTKTSFGICELGLWDGKSAFLSHTDVELTVFDSAVAPSVSAFWLVPMKREHHIFLRDFWKNIHISGHLHSVPLRKQDKNRFKMYINIHMYIHSRRMEGPGIILRATGPSKR